MALTVIATTASVAACSSSGGGGGSGSTSHSASAAAPVTGSAGTVKVKSIAWGDAVNADPQYKAMGDLFVKSAEALGIKVFRFDNNANGSTSVTNARLMVQQKPDVIIDYSGIASSNAAIGAIFTRSKIPCIAINVAIPGCSRFGFSQQQLGTDVGTAAGKFVTAKGWTGGNTNLIDAWSPKYGEEVNQSQTFFYSALAKALPQWKQADGTSIPLTTTTLGDHAVFVDGSGDLQTTNTVVKQALQSIPGSRNVIVSVFNHNSALGAQQALLTAHRRNFLIVSSGPNADDIKSIQTDPHWAMSADFFFFTWPKYTLAMAYAVKSGVTLPALTEAPIQATTKDNVSTFYGTDGALKTAPPLPSADAYLKSFLAQVGGALPKS